VRELRTAAELTQAELADRIGVTRQTIIAIERGGYVPSVALALLLATELSIAVERLFWLDRAEGEAP
jgi:putative transcriptional regulator